MSTHIPVGPDSGIRYIIVIRGVLDRTSKQPIQCACSRTRLLENTKSHHDLGQFSSRPVIVIGLTRIFEGTIGVGARYVRILHKHLLTYLLTR